MTVKFARPAVKLFGAVDDGCFHTFFHKPVDYETFKGSAVHYKCRR